IVPFSTMSYNTNRSEWEKWYPADLVTECFPGQFRNWFYSLLSMATMMDGTPPFRTLLGHRLVMNEHGQPMHKSDGTAIWFEEAAEQLGVDTMRWMYLAQNPAADLRFGLRHPEEPVTLETPEGPLSHTPEGLPLCRVTSKPSDEVRRQVLIPLWNSYAFFVNYARADGFNARLAPVADHERTEIDRWVLSRLQEVVRHVTAAWQEFDSPTVCRELSGLIDDLSGWYIRRNRRRFWRSGGSETAGASSTNGSTSEAGITADRDKLAAYQTLYQVLTTVTKLVAPALPFLAERMYQNLVVAGLADDSGNLPEGVPDSVHLCDYPVCDTGLLDPELNRRAAAAQRVVRLGHRLREEANQHSSDNLRVRQPLGELRIACDTAAEAEGIRQLAETVAEELNVKQLSFTDSLDELANYTAKPNLPTLGPKYGKLLGKIRQYLPIIDPALLGQLRSGETITIDLDGNEVELTPDDVLIGVEQAADWVCGDDGGIHLALSTRLTPELRREGTARDVVRRIQQLRKDSGLDIQDRIRIRCSTSDEAVQQAVEEWSDYIRTETLADDLTVTAEELPGTEPAGVGDGQAAFAIEKVTDH
ncbi:MAG: class I tRNA ligase family protein, partial [Planctomycetaceae bacterium]|nr:class I tRNA ligase family protein [Planctomycetaceae bacterium]